MKSIISILILLVCTSTAAYTQTTGSFNATITLNGQPRTLSVFVPINYSPSNQYPLMICLHGAGDNSNNYRNTLINSLSLSSFLPNTIIVCPDGGSDQARDFYTPAGDEAIIDSAMSYAINNYNISATNITLQGFSLGGRSALKYGLDHPAMFEGLMLHTPALQGIKDAMSTAGINYGNAPQVPIYITHGANDIIYTGPIDTAYEQLVLNDGIVRLKRYSGLGHTIPSLSQVPQFATWFAAPVPTALDLDVVRIMAPSRSCNAATPISVLVRNVASTTIDTIGLEYKAGTNVLNYTWSGTLAPYQHAVITLPPVSANAGSQNLEVKVTSLNNALPDTVTDNNAKVQPYIYAHQAEALPFSEDFEGTVFPPQGWVANRAGDAYSAWEHDDAVGIGSKSSMFAFNTILIFDNAGRREEMISPLLNLQSISGPGISFDVAYNYHRYTPPYLQDTTDFADTLEVYVSTDCGDSYQLVYKKGGAELATFSQPIINPLNINATYEVPAANNWRNEKIDLSAFAGSGQALVKFSYRSALGGFINIDNVRFHDPLGIKVPETISCKVYPNPATDLITIDAGNELIEEILAYDISGKVVLSINDNQQNHITKVDVSSLAAGIYILKITTGKGSSMQKVCIQK